MDRKSETIDRRDILVQAASRLIQRQGYARTTLAEIAEAGGVPLGSLYYYFKTKDEVLVAIVDRRVAGLRHLLVDTTESHGPRERLEALIQIWVTDKDIDALYGCPIGSLCYELAKQREGASSEATAKPLKFLLQWAEDQFRQLGQGKESPAHAMHMITVLQGASLVANAFNNPAVILQETDYLKAWLKNLIKTRAQRAARQ
jgi:TetR/AcrR family transcriptional repressor of nem operon